MKETFLETKNSENFYYPIVEMPLETTTINVVEHVDSFFSSVRSRLRGAFPIFYFNKSTVNNNLLKIANIINFYMDSSLSLSKPYTSQKITKYYHSLLMGTKNLHTVRNHVTLTTIIDPLLFQVNTDIIGKNTEEITKGQVSKIASNVQKRAKVLSSLPPENIMKIMGNPQTVEDRLIKIYLVSKIYNKYVKPPKNNKNKQLSHAEVKNIIIYLSVMPVPFLFPIEYYWGIGSRGATKYRKVSDYALILLHEVLIKYRRPIITETLTTIHKEKVIDKLSERIPIADRTSKKEGNDNTEKKTLTIEEIIKAIT